MATTQHSSPPPNIFNIVEHNNKHFILKHGEQEDEKQQEVFEYSHHGDEPPPRLSCGSSRASFSSSPSHEFSFTVCSLHTSQLSSTTADKNVLKESLTSSSADATAIDLSPADEIFFHGHLLPLHLLSGGHLFTSPRSSTNSLDSFNLPITSLSSTSNNNDSSMDQTGEDRALDSMEKPKSRSFSLFRNRATTTAKSRKSPDNQESPENMSKPHHDDDNNHNQHHKKNLNNKVKFDLSNAIKLVRSLLIFKQGNNSNTNSSSTGRKTGIQMRGQTFSYSGNLSSPRSNRQGGEVLRGRFSAPASMKTSPTNSGMFLEAAPPRNKNSNSNNDSTMEELQAAIQAAIAHCKNSSIAAAVASSCSR